MFCQPELLHHRQPVDVVSGWVLQLDQGGGAVGCPVGRHLDPRWRHVRRATIHIFRSICPHGFKKELFKYRAQCLAISRYRPLPANVPHELLGGYAALFHHQCSCVHVGAPACTPAAAEAGHKAQGHTCYCKYGRIG